MKRSTSNSRDSHDRRRSGVTNASSNGGTDSKTPAKDTSKDEGTQTNGSAELKERRSKVEVRKLEIDVEYREIELAALKRREALAKAEAQASNIYTFYSPVDKDNCREALAELGKWSRRSPGCPITIIFNSPGGSVIDGLALYDYIQHLKRKGHHVTTIALGYAASMGGVLLQAGNKRVIGENAFVLIHEVSSGTWGKVPEMEDSINFSKRLQKRLLAILAERSKYSVQQIAQKWNRKDWWLDADEVVNLGFADEILQ